MSAGLAVNALGVALSGRRVLRNVTAAMTAGSVTVILGPNGAGKSTLLRALAGLLPSSGDVTLDGRSMATIPAHERARRIGYLPQHAAMHWRLRVRDVVALGRLPHRSPFAGSNARDQQAIAAAMGACAIDGLADRDVQSLSGGERARVLLARVLAGTPDWLLADEPIASLDPAHQIDLLARLRDHARSGKGVVLVLHDLAHAARIADQVILLADGAVQAMGPPAAVLQPALLEAAYGAAFDLVDTADGPIPVIRATGTR
jgi:iron complex transport system ATP-binding protein